MIHPHRIRPNAANYGPTTHLFVDCESDQHATDKQGKNSHTLRCWCAERVDFRRDQVRNRRTAQGITPGEFWGWLQDQLHTSRRTWLWAHNAQVDMTWLALWANLDAGHIKFKSGTFSCPPFVLQLKIGVHSLTVVDSLNWFRCPLEKMGRDVGLEKLPMPDQADGELAWWRYCRRDVEILSATIVKLVQLVRGNELGMLRTTVSSQALASWRHTHKGPWPVIHGNPEISDIERRAYYGGMNFISFQGHVRADNPPPAERRKFERDNGRTLWGTRIHCLDYRGFYPSVMRGKKYPYRHYARLDAPPFAQAERIALDHECIAWVKIQSRKNVYPRKVEGGTQWARGSFWTLLAADELRWAILARDIARFGPMHVYESADLFTPWVEKCWKIRQQAEKSGELAWSAMVKTLSNSLHGKLGQHSRPWKKDPKRKCKQRWGEWIEANGDGSGPKVHRGIAGESWEQQPVGEHWNAFVAIPVCITANARAAVREVLEMLPPRSCLHHNTDSFHVSTKGYELLKAKGMIGVDQLGDLRRDRVALSAEYVTPSSYRLENDLTVAGIPRDRVEGEAWQWTYQLWESIRHRLNRGPVCDVEVSTHQAQLDRDEHTLNVDADGWTVPMEIDDDVVPF